MTFKFSDLLLKAVPLWVLGLQGAAWAQVLPVIQEPVAAPTSIVPATPDTTIVQQPNQTDILGGQLSDGAAPNVIHQFGVFDVGAGDTANFVVDPSVANVISLIDGLQPSSIDGLLQIISLNPDIASSANLVLVNPAGIVFGANASLNIPANLTATTASTLLFEDLYQLSVDGSVSQTASSSVIVPSSTVTVAEPATIQNLVGDPTGYVLAASPTASALIDPFSLELPTGSIHNQGTLQVSAQSTLALVGHYVQNDGTLAAPGGTVNLVAAPGDTLLRLSQPQNVLALDFSVADDLTHFSTTALPQYLTGGETHGANQISLNTDGFWVLATGPNLTPAPGKILVRGGVDVSDGATQGAVNIVGEHINLVGGDIHANGEAQAGTVSIGGTTTDGVLSAATVLVDRNSVVSADASTGTGGVIRIRAADTVRLYGSATATGATAEQEGVVFTDAGENLDIREAGSR